MKSEASPGSLIFSETLRMRLLPLSIYLITSIFLMALFTVFCLIGVPFLATLVLVILSLVLCWAPTSKHLFAKVVTEIRTDGLYVQTDFPKVKYLKLLKWNQFSEITLKYYPDFGHMGYVGGGIAYTPWSYGSYAAMMFGYYRYGSLYQKPLFGEKEVNFLLNDKTAGDMVVLDTNKPEEFVQALEKALNCDPNNSLKVKTEPKPTFGQRYLPKLLFFLFALLIIVVVTFASRLLF